MPDVVAGDTNAPAIAIPEKAAEFIASERTVAAADRGVRPAESVRGRWGSRRWPLRSGRS